MATQETTIPFSGFYESWHSANLDNALNQLVSDDHGDPITLYADGEDHAEDDGAEEAYISDMIDWTMAHEKYAKLYAENFCEFFKANTGVDLRATFDEMTSPREYNFTTDRIFMHIDTRAVWELYRVADKKRLDQHIADRFTSYDGFYSFYDNSLLAWRQGTGDVSKWDANQVGTLVESVIRQFVDDDGDFRDYVIMEDCNCNGEFDEILWSSMNTDGKAICDAYYKRRDAAEYFRTHQLNLFSNVNA